MRIRKGMTLIEIVISVFILSVISIIYMQNVTKQYSLLQEAKKTTKNVFASAKSAEQDMQNIKDVLEGRPSLTPLPAPEECAMFPGLDSRKIVYYPVNKVILDREGNDSAKSIYSVVADARPEEIDMPDIKTVDIIITSDNREVIGEYAEKPGVVVKVLDMDVSKSEWLLNKTFQWYISGPSWPMRSNDGNIFHSGISVPMFPQDFSPIPGEITDRLEVEPDMGGRHVLCVITPQGLSGKMGRPYVTKAKYLYGLPVLKDLAAHYDANLIDDEIGVYVTDYGYNENGSPITSNRNSTIGAALLPDISGNGAHGIFKRWPTYTGLEINPVDFPFSGPSDRKYATRGQCIRFSNSKHAEPVGLDLSAGKFTMFAVVAVMYNQLDILYSNGTIVSNGSWWSFRLDPADYPGVVPRKWYILGFGAEAIESKKYTSIGKDGPVIKGGLIRSAAPNNIKIGYNEELARASYLGLMELIIYDDFLKESDWIEVTQYLGEKYNLD